MMKKDWEIKKQNLEGSTPSTCEAGVSPLQTSSLPQHALKVGWQIKKLGEVCEIINGKNQKAVEDKNGPYPIYGSGGIMGYASEYLCRENTTIIGRKGSINNPLYVEQKFWNVDTAFGFQSKDNYNPKLLFYFCKSFDFNSHNKGTTIPSLVKSDLLEISIPVPPLEEQKRIVKILDEKFAQLETIKANAQTNLQNAKDLFQSQLTKAFSNTTWEKKRLGDCGTFKNGMNFAATDSGYTIRSLGVGDFKDRYSIDNTESLSEISLKAAPSEDYLLQDGDIVFVRSNGNKELVGRCLLVYPKNVPTTYSGFCIRFRKDFDLLDADFLLHFMKAESSRKILNGKEGANISNLNQKILGDFEVPLPPLPEQKRIVKELDTLSEKVRQLQDIYTKQISDCDELKQSLLAKAFEGEL